MTIARRLLFLTGLTVHFACLPVSAQTQPPPRMHWQKIKTPGFNVVFPRGLEHKANEVASLMEHIADIVPAAYAIRPKPINLYLNNQTIQSNGYVTLAPRYMEWFVHAPQDVRQTGSMDWFRLLAVHEYRHVVQFDFLKRNLTLLPYSLFGELGLSFVALWAVPQWFYEGDAVSAETVYSNAGRGRLPEFDMESRAILTGEQKPFTYNQAYLHSYRRYYPSLYPLGYYMHTHVARNYGSDTWPRVMEKVTGNPFSPYTFSRGLKKYTGQNLVRTYRNTVSELTGRWRTESYAIPLEVIPLRTSPTKVYTHYNYGHRLSDGSAVCLKQGMADAPCVVKISGEGLETRLRGLNNDMHIASNGQIVAWLSLTPDKRWGRRDYADIMILDLVSGHIRKITSRGKYAYVSVSPGGDRIAAVRYHDTLTYGIDIISTKDGTTRKVFTSPASTMLRTPSWSADETRLVYVAIEKGVSSIMLLDVSSNETKRLPGTRDENIATPVFWKDFVLFGTSVNGRNEIHALEVKTGKRYIALTGGYGFFNPVPSPDPEEIITEGYTENGYRLFSWKPDIRAFVPFNKALPADHYITPVVERSKYKDIFSGFNPDTPQHRIRKYHRLMDGIRLHSWAVLPSYQGVAAAVYASDPLSFTGIEAGIAYNQNEKNTNQYINLSYSGWYPAVSTGVSTGKRTMLRVYENDSSEYYQWHEDALQFSLSLPLNLTREAFSQDLNIAARYNYVFVRDMESRFREAYGRGNGTFHAAELALAYTGHRRMAMRDIYPSVGFALQSAYHKTLAGSDYEGSLFSLAFTGYLPGLADHHSLRIQGACELHEPAPDESKSYLFPSEVLFFRGYETFAEEKTAKLSVDYALPLFYPDLGLGSVLYIKRIRTNFFTDFGYGQDQIRKKNYFAVGFDLLLDFNIFRFLPELDMGIRTSVNRDRELYLQFIFFQRY